ncbi:MAG: DUF4240 domain-containing protein [Blastocatellia bacterium]|nr:DUF4240 domain-containing protein [Blastocatellia bacterium]
MKPDQFWKLMDKARRQSGHNSTEHIEILKDSLEKLDEADIRGFDQLVRMLLRDSYQADLWAAAYIINGGCAEEGFARFRAWLIGQGEKAFSTGVEKPDSLSRWVEDGNVEMEGLEGVAVEAYERKTGKTDFYDSTMECQSPHLIGSLDTWQTNGEVDIKKLKKLVPKLYKKFYG